MFKVKFPFKNSNQQLAFSQLRVKSARRVKFKSFVKSVADFLRELVLYVIIKLGLILRFIKALCFSVVKTLIWAKVYCVRKLIWSRGRLSRPVGHFAVLFLATTVFLTGGVFQSRFVSTKPPAQEYLAGVSDILPARVLAKTEIPKGRLRDTVIEYKVQSGDTLSSIGQRFGVTVESIRYANNLVSLSYLKVGQTLRIPPVSGVIHKVKSGDTLESVAKKYAVATQTILDSNYLEGPPFILKVGQELIIPGARIPAPRKPKVYNPAVHVKGTGIFLWPAKYHYITQYFSSYHPAIDIAKSPSPIYAADSGTVIRAGWWTNGYGFAVQIDHGNGYVTTYAHMKRIDVTVGESVERGEVIGQMGSTGRSTGPHVHFTVQYHGRFINPLSVL